MKTLILLRHAKSDWSESIIYAGTVSDIERPLSKRGYEACRSISQFFVSTKLEVDLVEYSSARRATDTFNAIKDSLHFSVQRQNSKLYTFSAQTLSGVQVVDHWFHPADGTVFALARLDLNAFTDSLEKMNELNGKVKEYVKKNAERAHMDLEREEEKR